MDVCKRVTSDIELSQVQSPRTLLHLTNLIQGKLSGSQDGENKSKILIAVKICKTPASSREMF